MSLVENLINQIASPASGGVTKPQGFNLDDDTFANLLAKAANAGNEVSQSSQPLQLGAPAGFEIEPFENTEKVNGTQNISPIEDIEIKDLKVSEDFFSSLVNDNSNVMNFAKRHAANAYNIFGKGFVDDLTDFVSDIASAAN